MGAPPASSQARVERVAESGRTPASTGVGAKVAAVNIEAVLSAAAGVRLDRDDLRRTVVHLRVGDIARGQQGTNRDDCGDVETFAHDRRLHESDPAEVGLTVLGGGLDRRAR